MNLHDLVQIVRNADPNISRPRCAAIVEAIFDGMSDALARQDKVSIKGFGTFTNVHRPGRPGRNIKTGETLKVPARQVAKFKPSSVLKDALNPAPRVGGRRMQPRGDNRARA